MNPGALEEGGRAVNTILDTLKNRPIILALLVIIFILLAYQFYDRREMLVARNQYVVETQGLLARCLTVDQYTDLFREFRQQREQQK